MLVAYHCNIDKTYNHRTQVERTNEKRIRNGGKFRARGGFYDLLSVANTTTEAQLRERMHRRQKTLSQERPLYP